MRSDLDTHGDPARNNQRLKPDRFSCFTARLKACHGMTKVVP
jgi:hypothetical protein